MKATKKFLATSTAVIIAASAIVPAASAASFKDIKGNAHENAIISLADQGIIGGYPDGTFKPNQNLTRSDVVKLLGKYLVSLGHEIPTDYKTKMRFTDLTAKSQDELLQYAALVKDLGVFQGSAGQLLHKDQLRRDQMATVLVRAFKVIKEYDYVAPMNEAAYKSTITDLTKTTAEHQEAIKTLAYHGVTKSATFSPKDPTKRGQFASFLYNMLKVNVPKPAPVAPVEPPKPVLTIKTVEVQAADKLRVVLSDDKAYIVTLKTSLLENVETEVTFEIGDKSYTTKVKYEVPDLKVTSITNPNGGQVAITFNQPVKLDAALDQTAINKLVQVYGVDRSGQVLLSKAQLSEDKKTLTATINASTGLEGRYRVVVDGIESATAKKLVKYDEVVALIADKTAPAIAKVENISATKVKVTFTEPVNNPVGAMRFTLVNGSIVTGITGTVERNATEVILDVANTSANGRLLDPGTTINVVFGTIIDLANNLSAPNPLTTYITKGNKDGVVPTLSTVTQLGAKKFKLTFSEELRAIAKEDIAVAFNASSNPIVQVEQDKTDAKSYIVTTANALNGYTTISTSPGKFITDLSGELNVFSTAYNFTADTGIPAVVSSTVVKDKGVEYLEFVFDRNVETPKPGSTVTLKGSQIINGITYPLTNVALIGGVTKTPNKDNAVRLRLSDVQLQANVTYIVSAEFNGVVSEFNQKVNDTSNVYFTRGLDVVQTEDKLNIIRVETANNALLGSTLDNNTIAVTFDRNVDGLSITKDNLANNFMISGVAITNAVIRNTELNKVYLTIQPNSIPYSIGAQLVIQNLRATNSIYTMEPSTHLIYLNDNIAPKNVTVQVTAIDTLVLTFDEAIQNVLADSFLVSVNGFATPATSSVVMPNQVQLRLGQSLTFGQTVQVSLNPNSAVTDNAKNALNFQPVQITATSLGY